MKYLRVRKVGGGRLAVQDAARLAAGAYGGQEVPGYEIDPDLSNRDLTTYRNPVSGEVTVAFRGTDFKNKQNRWRDLKEDANILFGKKDSKRFRRAEEVTNKAIQKYGKDKVEVTGHSLGGSQALQVGRRTGVATSAFNPGTSLAQVFQRHRYKPNVVSYTTSNDPISYFSRHVRNLNTVQVGNRKDAHSLRNFF